MKRKRVEIAVSTESIFFRLSFSYGKNLITNVKDVRKDGSLTVKTAETFMNTFE